MAQTEAQKRATERYRKANVRQLQVRFYPGEHDLFEFARSQENTAGYIKRLIREDMERASGSPD